MFYVSKSIYFHTFKFVTLHYLIQIVIIIHHCLTTFVIGPRLFLCGLAHLLKYNRAVPTGVIAHGNIRKLAESFVKSSQDANVPFEDFLQGLLRDDGTQIQGIVLKASH